MEPAKPEPAEPRPPLRARHARQARFAGIGPAGQARLARSSAAVVGLGALGTVVAETLARAGVGELVLIDRDTVEETNLQRQVLYTEADAAEGIPKAEAARRALAAIDGELRLRVHVEDLTSRSIARLLEGVDVILDGTDNFTTRYLLNDYCVTRSLPWIYGAAVGGSGLVLTVVPGGPCLRCVFPEPSPPEETPNCETAGILATASGMVALVQSLEAVKLLTGNAAKLHGGLLQIDPWNGSYRSFRVPRDPACPCCVKGERPWLRGEREDAGTVLCGRNSFQITPAPPASGESRRIDLEGFAKRVPSVERVNPLTLRFTAEGHAITLFSDGRAIVGGTTDPAEARSLYAKYIGL
jgi:adenylyltransferase/sulfurtransferase